MRAFLFPISHGYDFHKRNKIQEKQNPRETKSTRRKTGIHPRLTPTLDFSAILVDLLSRRPVVREFKPVAKCVYISHHGSLVNRSTRQVDVHTHSFPKRQLNRQYGRHSSFTHFYRHAGNQTQGWRSHRDINFQFEPRIPARLRLLISTCAHQELAPSRE